MPTKFNHNIEPLSKGDYQSFSSATIPFFRTFPNVLVGLLDGLFRLAVDHLARLDALNCQIHPRIQGKLPTRHQNSANPSTHRRRILILKLFMKLSSNWSINRTYRNSNPRISFRQELVGVDDSSETAVNDFRRHRRVGEQQRRPESFVFLTRILKEGRKLLIVVSSIGL